MDESRIMWQPNAARRNSSPLAEFAHWANVRFDYSVLHRWSITEPATFWSEVWDFCGVIGEKGSRIMEAGASMRETRWFPEARLNYAENLLRPSKTANALIFWGEIGMSTRMTRDEVRNAVAALVRAMQHAGVTRGDVVAAYLPNLPETVLVLLAASAIGAVFTSASPDFGVQGVLDRFSQVAPKLLFVADGYFYGGKRFETLDKAKAILAGLPSVRATVVVPYLYARSQCPPLLEKDFPEAVWMADFVAPWAKEKTIEFVRLPFDHPLYILYSSGTTGVPKCIVHRAGGVLLQHLKEHRFQVDVRTGDRVFYFTTCGWMMWNWLVSVLASDSTILLYDGSPFAAKKRLLFEYAGSEGATHFGTSAKFIDACAKFGVEPRRIENLQSIQTILSTGSPLSPESFDYVYQAFKPDVQLASISGGTDIVSCFVLCNPIDSVRRGEIQGPGLGMAVDVFRPDGTPAEIGEKGELVCTQAFPSMPLGFWNDADGSKYQAAYFDRFPGIWCHGDYAEKTPYGGFIIHGRSDATLNPGGVRIGTAEIYRQVEQLPEVVESIVIGQEWSNDVRVVLFVRLQENLTLDDDLTHRIREQIRTNTTPRHVPEKILQVTDIPRTKSGKLVELAVREAVHGRPIMNQEALANPEALAQFSNRPELAV